LNKRRINEEAVEDGLKGKYCAVVSQNSGILTGPGFAPDFAKSPANVLEGSPIMSDSTSLYEKIGGATAIDRFVTLFYKRVNADPLLNPFFANTDMDRQMNAQRQFMTMALGGPVLRNDFDLAKVHQGRGIGLQHLTRFTEHLLAALHSAEIDPVNADEIVARVATWSSVVLGESGGVDG
jgi:hemoglobin